MLVRFYFNELLLLYVFSSGIVTEIKWSGGGKEMVLEAVWIELYYTYTYVYTYM
jgi:hypothetical protein